MLDCVLGSIHVNSEHYMSTASNVLNIDNTLVERSHVGQHEHCPPSKTMATSCDWESDSGRFQKPVVEQQDTSGSRRVVRIKSPKVYCGKIFDELDRHNSDSGSNEKSRHLYSNGLNNTGLKLKEQHGYHDADEKVGEYENYYDDPDHKCKTQDRGGKYNGSDGGSNYSDRGSIGHSREDIKT